MPTKSKLQTVFTGDDRPFQSVARRVRATGERLNRVGQQFRGAFLAIGGGMLGRSLLVNIDRLGKLSTRFDIAAETLFKLKHVAEIGGADLETLAKGMKTLNSTAHEAAVNGLATYKREFEAVNINVDEFNKLSHEERLIRYANALNTANDRNKAFAATTKLMGRAGAEMFTILEQGGEVLAAQMAEVNPPSNEAVEAIQELNDAFTTFKNNIIGPVADGLRVIIETFQKVGSVVAAAAVAVDNFFNPDKYMGSSLDEIMIAAGEVFNEMEEEKKRRKNSIDLKPEIEEEKEKEKELKRFSSSQIFQPAMAGGFFGHGAAAQPAKFPGLTELQKMQDELAGLRSDIRESLK